MTRTLPYGVPETPPPGGGDTPEEIEVRLREQREALSASVDDLAARVDPRVQVRLAGEDLRERVEERASGLRERARDLRDRAEETIRSAKDGDSDALRRVATAAGGAVAVCLVIGGLARRAGR